MEILIYIAISAGFMYMFYFGCVLIIGAFKTLINAFWKEIFLTMLIYFL